MKSNINWVFLIFGIFLVLSCSKKNKRIVSPSPYDVELNQSKMEGNLINEKSTKNISEISAVYRVVTIQKTGCYGSCPDFEFILHFSIH